jgi:hypothetical protein
MYHHVIKKYLSLEVGQFEHILQKLHELQLLVGTLFFFPLAFYDHYTSHGLLRR